MRVPTRLLAAVMTVGAVVGCANSGSGPAGTVTSTRTSVSPSPPTASATASPGATRPTTVWLCRPGLPDNPCLGRLSTTVVAPGGSKRVEPFVAAADPSFDCFYIYPTVSKDPARNAPLTVTPELVRVVRAQAALFQRVCRLFAPVYRQVTLDGLFSGGYTDPAARDLAQRDVAAAFDAYLTEYSDGRPFLLLGHSQGAQSLTTLVQTRIDGDPALRARLVSAMLIGGSVSLESPTSTRGSFQNVPPCRSTTQNGCVVAYNTYQDTPPNPSLFGRIGGGRVVLCVNPAAPAGGSGLLEPIVPVPSSPGVEDVVGFAAFPDSTAAACRSGDGATWLQARRVPGSQLPDAVLAADRGPAWGLHRVDVTLALGTLIALAESQAAAR